MDSTGVDPLAGYVLNGRYRVRSRIARGGMATVYRGEDIKLDRTVALKVMHPGLVTDEGFVQRFIGEARNAAALSHPNIVTVYDQGTDQGQVFLAMEYVPGRTLRAVLAERGRLGPGEALRIIQPVLAALGAAHRSGLVHRDVKPENVLITADGQVKVADFGLARAESASRQTRTGMLIGTVGYLAPEQVLTGDADIRTDVYAAGIVLFELLTGRQPYQGATPLAVAYRHVNDVVPRPSSLIPGLPPQLDALVESATDREPARRPSSADSFHAAVAEVLRSLPPDIDVMSAGGGPAPSGPSPAAPVIPSPPQAGTQILSPPTAAPTQVPHGATRTLAIDGTSQRRRGRVAGLPRYRLLAAGALVVLLLGGLVVSQLVGGGERVPKLVGLSEHDARVEAANAGLKIKIGKARYDAVPKDKVAAVQPEPGTEVKKGTLLTLILSKGKRPVQVPDVKNLSLDQAKQRLLQAGLRPGTETHQAGTTVPRGSVITTRPPAGDEQSPDDPVALVVSTGIRNHDGCPGWMPFCGHAKDKHHHGKKGHH